MYKLKYKYNRGLKDYSRVNRNKGTGAERVFWQIVRNRQLMGFKFYRQFPMYGVIFDFYSDELSLVVEIDGSIHDEPEQKERDKVKDDYIRDYQMKIIRFTNEEVIYNIEEVKKRLIEKIKEIKDKMNIEKLLPSF